MAKEFPTTEVSLAQLSESVVARFGNSEAELYLEQRGGKTLSRHGDISEMLTILQEYCTQFPRGLLRLDLDHPYGIVVTLWCHCTMNTGCEIKCASDADRPKAKLVLSAPKIGNRLSPQSQAEISTQAQQEMTLSPPPAKQRTWFRPKNHSDS